MSVDWFVSYCPATFSYLLLVSTVLMPLSIVMFCLLTSSPDDQG